LPATYLSVVLRRSLGFWIGLRLLLAVVIALMAAMTPELGPLATTTLTAPSTSVIFVLLTAGVLLFDAHAVGEDLLLANFGVSRFQVALRACVIPTICELLLLGAFALKAGT
jgi:hypothetical protein